MRLKKAFTLVELIVVITIVAILLVLVVPAITNISSTSRISLRDSKIQTIVTMGEKYGNEVINDYQECLGTSTSEQLLNNCTVSLRTLAAYGYLEENDVIDPTTNDILAGNVLLCYDPAHVNVYASYIEDDNYSCKDISVNSNNSLSLSSVGGIGYIGGKNIEVTIIKSGDFRNFRCESSLTNVATCSISDNKMVLSITGDKNVSFGDEKYKEVTITLYGDYIDDDGNSLFLSKAYLLKVYPTDLKVVDDGKTCIPVGTSSQNMLSVLNVGTMSVTSSDKDILEGTAKDGTLYLSAKYKTGSATLTVKEANGNNTTEITKTVYNLNIGDVFPENMIVNHYADVEIEYSGTGTIKISSDNPNVLRFSTDKVSAASEITLTDETTFKIIANATGVAKVTIQGEYCGSESRDVTVSNIALKGETSGQVYIGGESKNVEIEIEEATNIKCSSSNPEAATCEIHATTVQINPGTKAADNVILTVGSQEVGYAYYRLQVLKTSIDVVNNSGQTVTTVCREKNSSYNSEQLFVQGVNLGMTQIYDIEDWYLAEADVAESGAQRNVTVFPRAVEINDSPYILGENTGRTAIQIKEDNGNQIASFNYNIYTIKASASSATLKVDDTIDFEVEVSGTGEISLSSSNARVASARVIETSTYSWTPNAINKRKIRVTANGTGSATISVRGADCGVVTFNVQVEGKSLAIYLVPGTYTTSLGAEVLSCETEGEERSCSVTFPNIYTSSEFQVVGYSSTKDSTTATYKPGGKFTITSENVGSTFYGNSMDTTKPVCSIPNVLPSTSIGVTQYLTMTCIDTGSGIKGTGVLSTSNFAISNASVGELVSVGAPTKVTNGYSYQIGVRNKQVGAFSLSLNANAVYDVFNNGNNATTLASVFATEYEVEDYYYVGKTNRTDAVAVLYDNAVLGSGSAGTYSLYIYGTGEMLDFMSSAYPSYAPWYNDYRTTITNLVVNNGITNVGARTVYNSTNLKSVSIASTVATIGESAFTNANISSVTIPNSVTTIGNNAFYGNKNLSSLTLGNAVATIGSGAFYNHRINSLVIPGSVTSIGDNAFGVELERSVLSTLQFASNSKLVTIGASAFIYHKLTSLSIPSTVTTIGNRAFEQADIESGTLRTVEFSTSSSLVSIGDDAFAYCALTSLSLPDSLQSIGARAFSALRDGVRSINLGSNVRSIGNNFAYGSDLSSITVANGNAYFVSANGVLYNKAMTTLVKCPDDYYTVSSTLNIPNTVTTIQAGAFDGWLNYGADVGGLTVNLPSTITNMNIADNFIFYATKAINISGNSQFDSVDGVLFNKSRTIAYRLPLVYGSSSYSIPNTVVSVADYFSYGNSRVNTITVPSSVTKVGILALATDTNYAFGTINLNSDDTLTFDDSSFAVMVYPTGASLSSRTRTINVQSVNLKSRLENAYAGMPYGLTVTKVGG